MYKLTRQQVDLNEVRLLTPEQLSAYLSLGIASATKFGKECGANRKFGKRIVYDRLTIDKALDRMSAES